jgi:nucleoside-diphosphate-sugar epimerase
MTGERVMVAGATGVLGRRVVRTLVTLGYEVVGLTRSTHKLHLLRELGAAGVVADAYSRRDLTAAVMATGPEVIIHQMTDLTNHDSAANARLRREGTLNLVAAASAGAVRRVVAQSIAWAYAPSDGPATESVELDLASPEPRSTTVRAVSDLEDSVLSSDDGVVVRYGLLYGPDTWFAASAPPGTPARLGLLTADESVTSFVHVDDAAEAAVAAIGWTGGVYNVVDDDPAPGREWVPDFCTHSGAAAPPPIGTKAPWACGAANARARAVGWAPRHTSWRGNWGTSS